MRWIRIALLLTMLALPLVLAPSASALDLCAEPHCQPPPAEHNTPYEFEFEAEEGCPPYRFSYLNGTVPPGLTITQDGKLTGTPTAAGDFEFWVALDDNTGPHNPFCLVPSTQSQAPFTLHVMPDLAVATQSLPSATPGTLYSVQLRFSNPEVGWPVVWDITAGTLPQGLSLSESGVISGTPAGPDLKQFTVRAREPFRRFGERQLTLTVAEPLVVRSGSTLTAPLGRIGVRFGFRLAAVGGVAPLKWSVTRGALPPGLSLNASTGSITGVPRAAGRFALTFAVTDAAGQQATTVQSIRIKPRLRIETGRLEQAAVGRSHEAHLSAGGVLRFSKVQWKVVQGSLPLGIRLGTYTGELRGIPQRSGTSRFTVRATELPGGARATKTFVLVVRA